MSVTFKLQPQRQAVGSFTGPNGQDVPVYMTQPWYRAFQALIGVGPDSGGNVIPIDGVTVDETPTYEFGDLVYRSGALTLRGLQGGELGQIVYSGGPGSAPFWGDAPAPAPSPAPAPAPDYLSDGDGRLLLDSLGLFLTGTA